MPRPKKRSAPVVEESDEEETILPKSAKKTKTTTSSQGNGTDKEGNPYWELSGKRRVGVAKFRDMTMINIREYWSKDDGEMLPGKKGISLTLEQYEALLKAVPQINAHLQSMGHDVEEQEDVGGAPIVAEASTKEKKKQPRAKKSNIEATSDEDEDEEE